MVASSSLVIPTITGEKSGVVMMPLFFRFKEKTLIPYGRQDDTRTAKQMHEHDQVGQHPT